LLFKRPNTGRFFLDKSCTMAEVRSHLLIMEYDINEFAEMMNVSDRTLRRWDKSGRLKAYRREGGEYFYTEEQAARYVRRSAAIVCPHCEGTILLTPMRIDKE